MDKISPTVEYIKSEMIRKPMSLMELADKLGKPYSTVWRIINGKTSPNIEMVEQIFAALELPPIGKNPVANPN